MLYYFIFWATLINKKFILSLIKLNRNIWLGTTFWSRLCVHHWKPSGTGSCTRESWRKQWRAVSAVSFVINFLHLIDKNVVYIRCKNKLSGLYIWTSLRRQSVISAKVCCKTWISVCLMNVFPLSDTAS